MKAYLWLAAIVLLLHGCSAQLSVKELKTGDDLVDGVPFRVRERFVVQLYTKTDKGYEKVQEQLETLANPYHVYILQHDGKAFANSDTKFTLRKDGTLAGVTLNADTTAPAALTALGEQVNTLSKEYVGLRQARETVRENERKKIEADQQALETKQQAAENSFATAKDAENKARAAEAALADLSPSTTPAQRLQKELEVEQLKLLANIAARRAGVSKPPF